jgi:hypothetical protein
MAGYETVTDCDPDLYGSWPGIRVNHEPILAEVTEVTELQGNRWLD